MGIVKYADNLRKERRNFMGFVKNTNKMRLGCHWMITMNAVVVVNIEKERDKERLK